MPIKPTPDDGVQLNLTPMIDVVFLLVIFFMAATQFADTQRDVELDLPDVDGKGTQAIEATRPLIVSVAADGATSLDGRPLSAADLTDELRAAVAERPLVDVLLEGDSRAPFERVAQAMGACRAAGVANLGVRVDAQPMTRK